MPGGSLELGLGYGFRQRALLEQALTHRSYGTPNNERLEFLGDSVLNCVIAKALYERFAHLKEGELSRLRANLVRQDALHRVANGLALGDQLKLGEGEMKSGGHRRPSILADALEALFGAVLLDGGFEAANDVILRLFAPLLAEVNPDAPAKDAKTALQEWLQGRRKSLPVYDLKTICGEDHAQLFEVECRMADIKLITTGLGASRRAAEQDAAQKALDRLRAKS